MTDPTRVLQIGIESGPREGETVELATREITIGRDPSCDVVLDDHLVSHKHASLKRLEDGTLELRDLGSTNGTRVDGHRIEDHVPLEGGEEIRIGSTVLRVAAVAPVPEATAAEAAPPTGPEEPVHRSTVLRLRQSLRRTTIVAVAAVVAVILVAVGLGTAFALGAFSGGGSENVNVERLERSTVLVKGVTNGDVEYIGSGTVIDSSGIILTNAHVGDPLEPGLALQYGPPDENETSPDKLVIATFQGEDKPAKEMYTAKVLAIDGYLDAAVLKIDHTLGGGDPGALNLPAIELGDSDRLKEHQPIALIGYPGAGGGFEGANNTSAGIVSGFTSDPRIKGTNRAWIKTDADINGGNSGGLAADRDGRIVGIPSKHANPNEGKVAFVRPINLLKPLIESAFQGQRWQSPYFVPETGAEKFTFKGWAASQPDESCQFQSAEKGYPAGTKELFAVYDIAGMERNEDWAYEWDYLKDKDSEAQVLDAGQTQWTDAEAQRGSCFLIPVGTRSGLPAGDFYLFLDYGPSRKSVDGVKVSVLTSNTSAQPGSSTQPTPPTPPAAPPSEDACVSWDPVSYQAAKNGFGQAGGSGFGVPAGLDANGQQVVESGPVTLARLVGDGRGYPSLEEAQDAAAQDLQSFQQQQENEYAQNQGLGPYRSWSYRIARWLVVSHANGYYAYRGTLWLPQVLGFNIGEASPGIVNNVQPHYEQNPERKPCLIGPNDGQLAAWHALYIPEVTNQPVEYSSQSQ